MIEKYPVSITWSEGSECFIAEVPGFSGVFAHGDTREEAARKIYGALEAMLESLEEDGLPVPEPRLFQEYSGQIRLRIPKGLHAGLAAEAERQGVSLNMHMGIILSQAHGSSLALAQVGELAEEFKSLKQTVLSACSEITHEVKQHGASLAMVAALPAEKASWSSQEWVRGFYEH